jgi:hypothetical protein
LPIVYDKDKVFGKSTSLENPDGLHASSVGKILDTTQYGDAKTSSAFAAIRSITLKPGQNFTIASVYGRANHIEELPGIADIVRTPGFVSKKFARARTLSLELTMGVETNTTNPLFDSTVKQMFLDNSLRGGIPTILGNVDADTTYDEDATVKVYHSFSRIHGDLERDYNAFMIDPTYFSQVRSRPADRVYVRILLPSLIIVVLNVYQSVFRVPVTTVMSPRTDVTMLLSSLVWVVSMSSNFCPLSKQMAMNH